MKIALAQCNFTVGDFDGNAAKIIQAASEAKQQGAEVVVFSELAISGYYPYDLVEEPWFMERQTMAIQAVAQASLDLGVVIVAGLVTRNTGAGKSFHNSLAVFSCGQQVAVYNKQLLPTYNVFDEARHFEPGTNGLVWSYQGIRIGFLICEDGWNDAGRDYNVNPWAELAENGAQLVVSINASPSEIGKPAAREAMFCKIAAKYNVPMIYVNQVGGNDALVFDGHSFACSNSGQLVARLTGFEEALGIVTMQGGLLTDGLVTGMSAEWESLVYKQIVTGIRDYVAKTGFKQVVVGSSGGIDSALALALAVKAVGAENVTAITMPGPYSSSGSVTDSEALCANLGIKLYYAPITNAFENMADSFGQNFGMAPAGLTTENVQARLRGVMLMAYSNQNNALVLSTGNKSEMSVGYATLYGDMNGGMNPLGDLYKSEVYALANWINSQGRDDVIPRTIIDKAPSAELAPDQRDSDSLPPYPVLDEILKLLIEGKRLTASEYDKASEFVRSLQNNGQGELVNKVWKMVARSEFKRRQAPPIIRVRSRAFGSGRQVPVAAQY